MLFRTFLSAVGFLAYVVVPGNAKLATRQKSLVCASGAHIIAASGDIGEDNTDGYGLLGSLVNDVVAAIPGSDNVTLPYPKDDPSGLYKANAGGALEVEYITDYVASCPETRIILVGYSLGGAITLNALCGASSRASVPVGALDSDLSSHIVGVVTYGEQGRTVLSSFNAGTCTQDGSRHRTGDSATCLASASKIRSYCDNGDAQCCNGFYLNVHRSYLGKYDKDATEFLTGLYDRSPPLGASSSSSASPSSSSQSASSATASTAATSSASGTSASITAASGASMSESSATPTKMSSSAVAAAATGATESPRSSPAANLASTPSLLSSTYSAIWLINCSAMLASALYIIL